MSNVREQIAAAKARQRQEARKRAQQKLGYKSGAAVTTTTPQSEITEQPPTLYQVDKINTPADFEEVARLLHRELTKIQQSQSYLLTMWQKYQDDNKAE